MKLRVLLACVWCRCLFAHPYNLNLMYGTPAICEKCRGEA